MHEYRAIIHKTFNYIGLYMKICPLSTAYWYRNHPRACPLTINLAGFAAVCCCCAIAENPMQGYGDRGGKGSHVSAFTYRQSYSYSTTGPAHI